MLCERNLNSLPKDKILDLFKLEAMADVNMNVALKSKFVYKEEEKTLWEKEKNAGNQRLSPFPTMLSTPF